MNKLPEKLTLLRKYYGLSQGDMAAKLEIPVTEYMNWENGNTIPHIMKLKEATDILHISLDAMVDNTKTIVLPKKAMAEETVSIPFQHEQQSSDTSTLKNLSAVGQTDSISAIDNNYADLAKTNELTFDDQSGTKQFQSTQINEIIDEPTVKQSVTTEDLARKQEEERKKKELTMIITGAVAAAAVLILVLILVFRGKGSSGSDINTLGNINRVAVGSTYSLYIDDRGSLNSSGTFAPDEDFTDLIQVSAYDDHAVGLKKDGTVVVSDTNFDSTSWKNIIMVAAGRTHTVGLQKDGTVVCTGSETACAVDEWEDIKAVYAGNAVTVGLKSDNSLVVSGEEGTQLQGMQNVKFVGLGDSEILVVKQDGTVESIALSGSSSKVSSWSNVEEVVVGTDFAAAVTSGGNVLIDCEDEDVADKVKEWTNIRHIAGNGRTLIAVTADGKIKGAGDNSYNQYVETEDDKDDKAEQLEAVGNVSFKVTTGNLTITWDKVRNADYYEISVIPNISSKIPNTSSTSASIPASNLTDGETYQFTITAKADDEKKYTASKPTVVNYEYSAKTIQLDSPSNVTGIASATDWTITWDKVEKADYYLISIDGGAEEKVTTNQYVLANTTFDDNSTHSVSIKAGSDNATYSESSASQVTLTYVAHKATVTFNFTADGATVGSAVVEVEAGKKYKISDLVQAPDGYELSNPGSEVSFGGDSSTEVSVKKVEEPVPSEEPKEGE